MGDCLFIEKPIRQFNMTDKLYILVSFVDVFFNLVEEFLKTVCFVCVLLLAKLKVKANKTTALVLVSALFFSAAVAVGVSSQTMGVAVVCNGRMIGYTDSLESAADVESRVRSLVYGDDAKLVSFSFKEKMVFKNDIDDVDVLATSTLEATDVLDKFSGLYVDGVLTAVAESYNEIESMIDALIKKHTANGTNFVGYGNNFEIKDVYTTLESVERITLTEDDFCEGKSGIQVLTARVESYEEEVPFETEVKHDATKIKGYSYVKKNGKNGLSYVTATVTYVNGQRYTADVITSEILKEPVTAKVIEGISDEVMASVAQAMASSKGEEALIFPCEITDSTYISSYWGDGRGHKAVDIASPYGSDIYAAADGTVSFAGYKSDYGYYIIVDHEDGKTQTLYSHCSKMLVKKGAKVTQGQVIGRVGATGRATGNHLHFSVIKNGIFVDPAPYIGLTK